MRVPEYFQFGGSPPFVSFPALEQVSAQQKSVRAVPVSLGELGPELYGPVVAVDCLSAAPLLFQNVAKVVVRVVGLWFDLQHPSVAGLGLKELAIVPKYNAEIIVSLGVIRAEFDRPFIIVHRLIVSSQIIEQNRLLHERGTWQFQKDG